jgi:serine/threonine protein kinase/Tol biopolymer transport system component
LALGPGTRLGAYEILTLIGSGGMGEVYRAHDSRLNRDVAVKVLPADVAADHDRLARFEREAQVLASLNHPNIANIYGVDDSSGTPALVMELVEGPTLADRIAQGPIPIDEALPIAKQIAEALEAAHEQGIIHRDLKPANVKVRTDGTVKVLDFGLAKALEAIPGPASTATMSPTITTPAMTQIGMILGTAAYMAPEQAKGQAADRRSDIWAFGCVVYELVVGRRAFKGIDLSETLASVLKDMPDWRALPASTPAALRRLLHACLEKNPRVRLQAVGDARVEIEHILAGSRDEFAEQTDGPVPLLKRVLPWAASATVLGTLFVVAVALLYVRPSREPLTRLEVLTPSTTDPGSFAVSPNGRQLVFEAMTDKGSQLWVRPLDGGAAQPLAGTEGGTNPFWAPNNQSIGFFADGRLKRIDLAGGAPQPLADAAANRGGTWSPDGSTIVFTPSTPTGLMRVPAFGGTPTEVVPRVGGNGGSDRWPHFLPDGRHVLFLVSLGRPDIRGVYFAALDGGAPLRVLRGVTEAAYAQGHILFVTQGTLVAQPFDPGRGTLSGEPVPVAQGVGNDAPLGRSLFSVSETGLLVHRKGVFTRQLAWFDRTGKLKDVVGPFDDAALSYPELAPDSQRLAAVRTPGGSPTNVWITDLSTRIASRFTTGLGPDAQPIWSPDGRRIIFRSARTGNYDLLEKPADGSSDERTILPANGHNLSPQACSPDGKFLLYASDDFKTASDLWALPLQGDDRTPFPVAHTDFDEVHGQFSPDGHWIAYASNESGRYEVYVQAFPKAAGKRPVSAAGGIYPRWRRDGRELYYVTPDNRLVAVPMHSDADGTGPTFGEPTVLFATRMVIGGNVGTTGTLSKASYDVAHDGRFLMLVMAEDTPTSPINIVLNWPAALRR